MSTGVTLHLPNSKPCLKMGGPLPDGETGTRPGGMCQRGLSESSRRCVRRSGHEPVRTLSSGSRLFKEIRDGYPPSGYGWIWDCDFPSPEDNGMFRVAGFVGLNDVLAQ